MSLANQSLDEIVFENKNKSYGAYFLRKKYPDYVKYSLFGVIALTTILLVGPFIYNKYIKEKPKEVEKKKVEVDLTTIEIPPLNPETSPPPPPPPPPPKKEEPKIKTVKHVPPKVVPDEEVVVEELPPTEEELDEAVISNVTQEGEKDTLGLNELADINNDSGVYGLGEEDNQLYMAGAGIDASFPGGQAALQDYFIKRMKPYSQKAAKLGDKGLVYIFFIVEKDGSISNVKVLKGLAICESCNDAAKKMVEDMPKWEPAKNNGRPVRLQKTLPINFDFDD